MQSAKVIHFPFAISDSRFWLGMKKLYSSPFLKWPSKSCRRVSKQRLRSEGFHSLSLVLEQQAWKSVVFTWYEQNLSKEASFSLHRCRRCLSSFKQAFLFVKAKKMVRNIREINYTLNNDCNDYIQLKLCILKICIVIKRVIPTNFLKLNIFSGC